MAWNGPPTRCTLQTDLTRYHQHLVVGSQGVLVPEIKTTSWGSLDRFGAVKFDCCGHTLDIVLANLDIEGIQYAPLPPTPQVHMSTSDKNNILDLLEDLD